MPATLTTENKIKIVLVVGENYKTYREAAEMFNNQHPEKNPYYGTVMTLLNKFKTSGNTKNTFSNKCQQRIFTDKMEFEILISPNAHPKKSLQKSKILLTMILFQNF